MKALLALFSASFLVLPLAAFATEPKKDATLVYVNQNIGFNVPGYKYSQSEFPCDIDKVLVKNLISQAKKEKIQLEAVGTPDKIKNGEIPVLAIDVEELVLGKHQFGAKSDNTLPKVQIMAALIKGKDFVTAKHTCAIATLNEFTPSSNILDLGTTATMCSATRKCLRDLSNDVVQWMAPQVK